MTEVARSTMPRVAITGFGIVSPLGSSVEEWTARFAAGEQCAESPESERSGVQVGEIPLDAVPAERRARLGRLDRLSRIFLSASYRAVQAAGLEIRAETAHRVGLSFGTGLGCLLTDAEYNQRIVDQGPAAASPRLFAYTVSSAAAGEVSIAFGIHGPNATAHFGLAAGLGAVGYGFDLIQAGKADAVLAGAADVTGPALVDGLRDMGLLKTRARSRPFVDTTPGVWPSEAAVVVVLERLDLARRRGARVYGCVEGWAAGFEPTLTRGAVERSGLTATVRRALDLGGRGADEIGLVLASAHGTPLDTCELQALAEVLGDGDGSLLLAPKRAHGESFAASGGLALALAAGLMREPARLAPGLAFDLAGRRLDSDSGARHLARARVVMVSSLCYAGPIVNLLLGRDEESR